MRNKFKIIFIFTFIFLLSSCSRNKKDNFDFSDFKVPVKESISNESKPIEKKNLNTIQYELRPFRNREEILSSFKFEKKDPFKLDSQTSNKLSDIKLKGFLTISNKIGLKSLQEVEDEKRKKNIEKIKNEKLIKKILEIIPSSEVISVKPIKKTIQEE